MHSAVTLAVRFARSWPIQRATTLTGLARQVRPLELGVSRHPHWDLVSNMFPVHSLGYGCCFHPIPVSQQFSGVVRVVLTGQKRFGDSLADGLVLLPIKFA